MGNSTYAVAADLPFPLAGREIPPPPLSVGLACQPSRFFHKEVKT